MATVEQPITRSELREELDRTFRYFATKADLERLKIQLLLAQITVVGIATGVVVLAVRFWQ